MINHKYSYPAQNMSIIFEVLKQPGGVAILSFDNKTYEVTVKQIAPTPVKPKRKRDK